MRGLIIFSNHMEDNEALSTLALLRRAGMDIDAVTHNETLMVKTAFGITVKADYLLSQVDLKTYDFLVVPGGRYVAEIIDDADYMYQLITTFRKANKDIYAICAAPRFLGRLGILDGVAYTAFPGSEKDAIKGDYLGEQKVVVTPKIITARSAGAVVDFVYEIVRKNKGEASAKSLIESIMYWMRQI